MRVKATRSALVVCGALLVAVAKGAFNEHDAHGGPHDGPFGHEGREGREGPEGREGHEGREDHRGPFGGLGHPDQGHQDEEEGHHIRESECTTTQTRSALEAAATYVKCALLDDEALTALLHADIGILRGAAACFKAKAEEITDGISKDEMEEGERERLQEETEEKLASALTECVKAAETEDEGAKDATHSTSEFLEKLFGDECAICSCLPAFLNKMPYCEPWTRYHDVGVVVEDICEYIDNCNDTALLPGIDIGALENGQEVTVDLDDPAPYEESPDDSQDVVSSVEVELPSGKGDIVEVKAVEPQEASAMAEAREGGEGPHLPNAFGPCPPGQENHPDNPQECQPPLDSENAGFSGPPRGGGGFLGLAMPVMGVVTVGGVVGFGAVWAWSKFQSGTRQPGVRYMATDLDNNIGTELGPFGRQYA